MQFFKLKKGNSIVHETKPNIQVTAYVRRGVFVFENSFKTTNELFFFKKQEAL